jgi:hypothetical protein
MLCSATTRGSLFRVRDMPMSSPGSGSSNTSFILMVLLIVIRRVGWFTVFGNVKVSTFMTPLRLLSNPAPFLWSSSLRSLAAGQYTRWMSPMPFSMVISRSKCSVSSLPGSSILITQIMFVCCYGHCMSSRRRAVFGTSTSQCFFISSASAPLAPMLRYSSIARVVSLPTCSSTWMILS